MRTNGNSSGQFCCTTCNYETEVYSTNEFVRYYTRDFCPDCGHLRRERFYPEPVMMHSMLNNDLEYKWGYLSKEISSCSFCLPPLKIHWTELKISCPNCANGVMMFKHHPHFGTTDSLTSHLHYDGLKK